MLHRLPPSSLSFQTYAQSLHAWVAEGGFYFEGGIQTFTDALTDAIRAAEGELVTGSAVTEILVSDGRAAGVVLESGDRLSADMVISNADAARTFAGLVGNEHVPSRYLRKLARLKPAGSAVTLCAATTLDLAAAGAADTVLASGWDREESYANTLAGRPDAVVMRFPSLVDPSLAPAGEHVAVVIAFTAYEPDRPWEEQAGHLQEALLGVADETFPGFRDGLTHAEVLTPAFYRRMSRTNGGSTYGWEANPAGAGAGRPAPRTPLPGLYLAGAWTQPGGCFLRSTLSGVFTSRLAMRDAGIADPEGRFGHVSLPALG